MEYYEYSYCVKLVSKYKEEIDKYKEKIWKNYKEMDLSNAAIQADIEAVVNEMRGYCDSLKESISDYYFE